MDLESYLYYPERMPPDLPPPPWAGNAQEVWLGTDDGVRIHGLWWGEPADDGAILFLHGNAQDAYQWSPVHEELGGLGRRMLLIDYRGYGKSEGEPRERGLYSDGRAALEWLRDSGVDDEDIVVIGKSLGGAVACGICGGLPLRGLVLESTFTSLLAVARNLFPFQHPDQPRPESYNSQSKLRDIHCPVLVIHGDADMLIPVREGMALYAAANSPKELYVVEGAGHNDVSLVAGEEYVRRIRNWLEGNAS